MKSSRVALVLALVLVSPVLVGRAQDSNAPPVSSSTLGVLESLIAEAKAEVSKGEGAVRAAREELSLVGKADREAVQQRVATAQSSLEAARQKLAALEQGEAALRDRSPIESLIVGLKQRRDALPNPGTAAENIQRAEWDLQIAALEGAQRAVTKSSDGSTGQPGQRRIGTTAVIAIAAAVVFVGVMLFGLG